MKVAVYTQSFAQQTMINNKQSILEVFLGQHRLDLHCDVVERIKMEQIMVIGIVRCSILKTYIKTIDSHLGALGCC